MRLRYLRMLALGLLATSLVAGIAISAQAPPPWPRYEDPVFALIHPITEKARTAGARAALADLDRVQSQIAAAPLVVQARAAFVRAELLRGVGEAAAAERSATEARAFGARANHAFIEFDSLIFLVNAASSRGDLDRAAALVAEAVPIADRIADDVARFNVRLEQGRIARARGRGRESLVPLNEAVAIATRLNAARMRVASLGSRSSAYLGLSEYDAGLADAELAYEIASAAGMPPDLRGSAAFSLAQVLSQIGDLERGLDLWTTAIEAYSQSTLPLGVALAVRQRMDVRAALGDDEGAAEDALRALDLFAKNGSQGQEPAVLSRLALIEARLGRRDLAITHAASATAKAGAAPPRVRTQVESDLANAALEAGNFPDAAARWTQVLDQARTLRDRDIEWRAETGLGRAAHGTKDFVAAGTHFDRAIALVEQLRRELPEAGLRADFLAERLAPYDGLIETLLARSRTAGDAFAARAFDTSERARGRALADLLSEAQRRLTDPAVAAVRAQEAEFGRRFSALQRSLGDAQSPAERANVVADLTRAEREYDALVVRIRRNTPRYAALAHPRPLTTAEVSAGLGETDALVSFWTAADRGVVWILTRSGVQVRSIPGRRALDADVARLQSAITGRQGADARRLGAALHRSLLTGVDYAHIKRLIIVPDGPLWRAPFAALVPDETAGSWVVERAAVSIVPSASLLVTLARPAASSSRQPAIVFGLENVPASVRALRALYDERLLPARPLPYAVTEARDIARLAAADPRSAVFLNERADESSFKRAAAAPLHVVHVASHALIDDRVPRRSALVLSPSGTDDGLLQLNEIANLQLDADLVVLSTCQSLIGRAVRGEGLISLGRAFIHSGARAVAASLWAVDDRETSKLMPFFYAALKAGQAPDDALRTAQLQMIRAGGSSAGPSSWAGFVLMGRADRRIIW